MADQALCSLDILWTVIRLDILENSAVTSGLQRNIFDACRSCQARVGDEWIFIGSQTLESRPSNLPPFVRRRRGLKGSCWSSEAALRVTSIPYTLRSKLTASSRVAVERKRAAGFQIEACVGQERVAVVPRVRPAHRPLCQQPAYFRYRTRSDESSRQSTHPHGTEGMWIEARDAEPSALP